jgi:beta-glucosidase
VFAFMGHFTGEHAPGLTDLPAALQTAHHALVAHGQAADAIRTFGSPEAQVGITLNLYQVDPATDRQADLAAARRYDGYLNRWFLDPLFRARYPEDVAARFEGHGPRQEPGDLAGLSARVDFLGINNYTRAVVGAGDDPPLGVAFHPPQDVQYTQMGWEVYPDGLYELLVRVQRDYDPAAVYITENGAAFPDRVDPDGQVDDGDRVDFLHDYLFACRRALEAEVPLKGYFVWTLLDNFEWAHGYSKRFGIVYVDFATQERTIKRSGRWYQEMIAGQ